MSGLRNFDCAVCQNYSNTGVGWILEVNLGGHRDTEIAAEEMWW
jgi:hypothetical protein